MPQIYLVKSKPISPGGILDFRSFRDHVGSFGDIVDHFELAIIQQDQENPKPFDGEQILGQLGSIF